MNKRTLLFLTGLASPLLSGCGPKPAEAVVEKPAVVINKLQLTQEELKHDLKTTSSSMHGIQAPTGEEPEWLSRLIERELLVQEAQRLGLDREPDFMRTIERFWKEALIKLLLDRKAEEIGDRIRVYEPEIEERYKELVKEGGGQPIGSLSDLRDEISRTVRQKKEAKAMDQWINELRGRARIVIDRGLVSQLE